MLKASKANLNPQLFFTGKGACVNLGPMGMV